MESENQYFLESPFSLLADVDSARCWAGRRSVLGHLTRLLNGWKNRADSTLDVMWANLGSGKTHALLHLSWLLQRQDSMVPVFVEMPENIRDFLELYQRIAPLLPISEWAKQAAVQSATSGRLSKALRALAFGQEGQQQIVSEWICGGRPHLKDLRSVTGIDSRIESDVDAESLLHDLIRIAAVNGQRIVLLIDEFQRVGRLPVKRRDALLAHLRSVFSRNPKYFSVVLAVGSRAEATALELLPGELRTILGMRPSISLPEMSPGEAMEFVLERFACFRPPNYKGAASAPFAEDQLRFVISYISEVANSQTIPRTILQALGEVFDALGPNPMEASLNQLEDHLKSLRWDETYR